MRFISYLLELSGANVYFLQRQVADEAIVCLQVWAHVRHRLQYEQFPWTRLHGIRCRQRKTGNRRLGFGTLSSLSSYSPAAVAVCASMLGIQLADLDLRKGLAHFVAKLRWLGASLGRELLGSARGKQREGCSSLCINDKRCVCQWSSGCRSVTKSFCHISVSVTCLPYRQQIAYLSENNFVEKVLGLTTVGYCWTHMESLLLLFKETPFSPQL